MNLFYEWIKLKISLATKNPDPPHVSEGDIWWAAVGQNIGTEINGKSVNFTRPVVILKKFSHRFYFVIPLTTKLHKGSWYRSFYYHGLLSIACLHQGRSIDHKRLYSKIGKISDKNLQQILESFLKLYL
jgi:mRNA interferase MazF